jgi:rubrerythrin
MLSRLKAKDFMERRVSSGLLHELSNSTPTIMRASSATWAAKLELTLRDPHVGSTVDNLRTALADQRFETDYLYPAFLNEAVSLLDTTAIRSFTWALEADKSHARLYSDAIARLNTSARIPWAYSRHDFFVCALCGYTAENPESENCPCCNLLWERFEIIR